MPTTTATGSPALDASPHRDDATDERASSTWPLTVHERVHHDCHVMLWQHEGSTDLALNGRRRVLTAEHVCVIHAGVVHEFEVGANGIVMPLFLRLGLPVESLPVGTTRRVDRPLRRMLLRLAQYNVGDLLRTGQDVEADVVAHLLRGSSRWHRPPLPRSREAVAVARAVARAPESSVGIDALAAATFVSTRTVERQFKSETGMTPQAWRAAYRLALAAEIISGGTPPAVVGAQVGYTDDAAFRRAFKAAFGMTPRRFALREVREAHGPISRRRDDAATSSTQR